MPISPFTSLQIAGIAVLVYALLNTIFNLTLIARDIVQHGYKKRLTQFVSVLSAFLSVITTLVACWYTGDATIGVITNDGLNTLRILYGISTTTLLIAIVTLSGQSIYKFDTILPHVETPVRKWGFRILYGLHSCIFLVCLVYNIVSVNTLFFVTDEFKAGTTALGFNIAWCSVLEGFVSAIFLRALLVHKTKIVSGNYQSNTSNSTKPAEDVSDKVAKKLELLKKITFYVVSTFVMVIAVITLVVIKFLFVKANTDGSYLIRYATLSFLILYMTANLLQRKIITTIFQQ